MPYNVPSATLARLAGLTLAGLATERHRHPDRYPAFQRIAGTNCLLHCQADTARWLAERARARGVGQ